MPGKKGKRQQTVSSIDNIHGTEVVTPTSYADISISGESNTEGTKECKEAAVRLYYEPFLKSKGLLSYQLEKEETLCSIQLFGELGTYLREVMVSKGKEKRKLKGSSAITILGRIRTSLENVFQITRYG